MVKRLPYDYDDDGDDDLYKNSLADSTVFDLVEFLINKAQGVAGTWHCRV